MIREIPNARQLSYRLLFAQALLGALACLIAAIIQGRTMALAIGYGILSSMLINGLFAGLVLRFFDTGQPKRIIGRMFVAEMIKIFTMVLALIIGMEVLKLPALALLLSFLITYLSFVWLIPLLIKSPLPRRNTS